MDIAVSKNSVVIRLTDERWYHISTGHPELADYYYKILETIENPFCVYKGKANELIAIKYIKEAINKFIVVIYKEISASDGFIITAYLSAKENQFDKKEIIWKQP